MIYCCYPGTGKSVVARERDDVREYRYDYPPEHLRKYPLDDTEMSELFSYCDQKGKEIERLSKKTRYLLTQTDFRLFTAMDRKGIPYTIVIPDYRIKGMKEIFLKRYIKRGTTGTQFLHEMIERWDSKMVAFENRGAPKIYLKANEYVADVLQKADEAITK